MLEELDHLAAVMLLFEPAHIVRRRCGRGRTAPPRPRAGLPTSAGRSARDQAGRDARPDEYSRSSREAPLFGHERFTGRRDANGTTIRRARPARRIAEDSRGDGTALPGPHGGDRPDTEPTPDRPARRPRSPDGDGRIDEGWSARDKGVPKRRNPGASAPAPDTRPATYGPNISNELMVTMKAGAMIARSFVADACTLSNELRTDSSVSDASSIVRSECVQPATGGRTTVAAKIATSATRPEQSHRGSVGHFGSRPRREQMRHHPAGTRN